MKADLMLKTGLRLLGQPGVLLAPGKYVFILSHMRSYSTLLSHILGSHPQITGYAEMHQSYQGDADLLRLRIKVFAANDFHVKGNTFLDKILHNERRIDDEILNHPGVHVIFLLREPESALSSICSMGRKVEDMRRYAEPQAALDYYTGRLAEMAALGRRMRRRYYFLVGERLISESAVVLGEMQSFLGLDSPLSEHYQTFQHTGQSGFGDMSENVKAGQIVRSEGKARTPIAPGILEQGWQAHRACRAALDGGTPA